ncbi:MAG: asparaginase [Ilumatobacteraceae bacterium]
MATPESFAPVAVTRRSGCDESVHFGAVVGISPTGEIDFAIGDPTTLIYPRSSNKPMQAVAMVRAGLRLPSELLALVCASHDGTPAHLDAVLRILATAGLDDRALANIADLPLDDHSAEAVLRAGGGPTPLQMNCSGKHSGMLVTSAINDWPTDAGYLSAEHPLQLCVTAAIDDLAGEPHSHIGVDGCGAPAHVISLIGLARAFRSIATGTAGSAGDDVYAAMTGYPQMVGGLGRDVTHFMRHVPGLMCKDGADGVFAAALPDGRAVALKIADGSDRARPPVMVAALRGLGIDTTEVEPFVVEWILGHGQHVGEVRAIAP